MKSHLPNMHMKGFGRTLRKYAAEVGPYADIVEVGSWLGGSAFHLAEASGDLNTLHLYDKWTASGSEVVKARLRGEQRLKLGHSFKHVVEENLSGFGDRIKFNQCDIRRAEYHGRQIGLYVDDASKNRLNEVLPIFEPYFMPGTIVMLMDYFWEPCDGQRDFVEKQGWEFLARDEFDTNCAIWRVR